MLDAISGSSVKGFTFDIIAYAVTLCDVSATNRDESNPTKAQARIFSFESLEKSTIRIRRHLELYCALYTTVRDLSRAVWSCAFGICPHEHASNSS